MRIKLLTSIAGVNYSHKPGDEVDWRDAAEAQRFVNAGYATKVAVPPPPKEAKSDKPKDEKPKDEKSDKPKVERTDGKKGDETSTLKR